MTLNRVFSAPVSGAVTTPGTHSARPLASTRSALANRPSPDTDDGYASRSVSPASALAGAARWIDVSGADVHDREIGDLTRPVPQRPHEQQRVRDLAEGLEHRWRGRRSTRPGRTQGARRARARTPRPSPPAGPGCRRRTPVAAPRHQASATPSRMPARSRSAEHRAGGAAVPTAPRPATGSDGGGPASHHRFVAGGDDPLLRAVELRRQPPPAARVGAAEAVLRRAARARRRRRAARPRPRPRSNLGPQLAGQRADELDAVPGARRPPPAQADSSAPSSRAGSRLRPPRQSTAQCDGGSCREHRPRPSRSPGCPPRRPCPRADGSPPPATAPAAPSARPGPSRRPPPPAPSARAADQLAPLALDRRRRASVDCAFHRCLPPSPPHVKIAAMRKPYHLPWVEPGGPA